MIHRSELSKIGSEITAIQNKMALVRAELYRNSSIVDEKQVRKELEELENKVDHMQAKYSRKK